MTVRNCAALSMLLRKSSGSGSLEQAVDDIKTFANTASFLANKLDTRLKGGEVKAKTKPKSRVGKAIASVPKPNIPKSPSSPPDPSSANTSGMPMATNIATSQADFDRLKPQRSQPPVGPVDRSGGLLPPVLRFKGSHLIVPLCVAANAGWWITQGFGVKLHDF